ncbi:hypothetical protein TcasGA2_TC034864 [Tribolium castaneum]|uniref:Uncharacterized protein n=1 Tax=Tribolium castaneum TaxID=7070 RepID=A0A139WCE3_TRICA|nr:hypothetical protein TcasGA2_TC034864 [Tribolium castaneum]
MTHELQLVQECGSGAGALFITHHLGEAVLPHVTVKLASEVPIAQIGLMSRARFTYPILHTSVGRSSDGYLTGHCGELHPPVPHRRTDKRPFLMTLSKTSAENMAVRHHRLFLHWQANGAEPVTDGRLVDDTPQPAMRYRHRVMHSATHDFIAVFKMHTTLCGLLLFFSAEIPSGRQFVNKEAYIQERVVSNAVGRCWASWPRTVVAVTRWTIRNNLDQLAHDITGHHIFMGELGTKSFSTVLLHLPSAPRTPSSGQQNSVMARRRAKIFELSLPNQVM